jgi:transketolase
MRRAFFKELYKLMKENPDIWVVTGDLGYIGFDKIRDDFPDRFVNAGASEQAMMGIAVGLALKGKIPFVYSITPFLLRRPYETIKLYLDGEKIPVMLIGSGRNKDYAHDGPSHDATDANMLLGTLPNITTYFPDDKKQIPTILKQMIKGSRPSFLSLKR